MIEQWRVWVGFVALAMTWFTIVSNQQVLVKPTLIVWAAALLPTGF